MENAENRNKFVMKEIEKGNLKRAYAVMKENTHLKLKALAESKKK